MAEIKTIKCEELDNNCVKQFYLEDDTAVAIYKLDGEYFATSDVCTHGQAFLSDGEIRGNEIVCPYHEGTFDIKTGEPVDPPCVVPLCRYDVEVKQDGYIWISVLHD